jgi:hypothetical protein
LIESELSQSSILVLSALLSLVCVLHLWLRRPGSIWRRVFWSIALWVPLLGPMFYATVYRIPSKKPDSEIPETGHQY